MAMKIEEIKEQIRNDILIYGAAYYFLKDGICKRIHPMDVQKIKQESQCALAIGSSQY